MNWLTRSTLTTVLKFGIIFLIVAGIGLVSRHQSVSKFATKVIAKADSFKKISQFSELLPDDGASPVFSALSRRGSLKDDTTPQAELVMVQYTPLQLTPAMNEIQLQDAFVTLTLQRQIICKNWEMYGKKTDGGWPVCDAKAFLPQKPCTVYSFGIRNDWSFDDVYREKHGCTLRTFDPSMGKTPQHEHKPGVMFYPFGLSNKQETNRKGWKMNTYKGFLEQFGEKNMTIPYLKFDIDGSEWDVLTSMLADGSLKNVKQLSFEVHTNTAHIRERLVLLKKLEDMGFRRWFYHHRLNGFSFQCDQSFVNMNFLK